MIEVSRQKMRVVVLWMGLGRCELLDSPMYTHVRQQEATWRRGTITVSLRTSN